MNNGKRRIRLDKMLGSFRQLVCVSTVPRGVLLLPIGGLIVLDLVYSEEGQAPGVFRNGQPIKYDLYSWLVGDGVLSVENVKNCFYCFALCVFVLALSLLSLCNAPTGRGSGEGRSSLHPGVTSGAGGGGQPAGELVHLQHQGWCG